ncbi:hypothetical protein DLAC_07610 [Tieghemostelium lacteum]|uniref:Copper transport protein n=1 Tax=Tieghemostelium lacteum TaxID=361077 RepID=A0A151ZD15_TIELA|nr:hypothetical protein DLAC_07610 [Tieghemostelium lacteum]|eukprot:KYQ91815.1 hypothetical protein DLAC_07610 [Tieghemostelium lacteum]
MFSEYWTTYRASLNQKDDEELPLLDRSPKNLMKRFFASHIWKSMAHMFGYAISYLIMLIFMTYNGGLAIAILLGFGLGHFLFARDRIKKSPVEEICH